MHDLASADLTVFAFMAALVDIEAAHARMTCIVLNTLMNANNLGSAEAEKQQEQNHAQQILRSFEVPSFEVSRIPLEAMDSLEMFFFRFQYDFLNSVIVLNYLLNQCLAQFFH